MREQLEAQFAEAAKTHEANRQKYRKAMAKRNEAEAEVRTACAQASESANVVAALKTAIDRMPAASDAA